MSTSDVEETLFVSARRKTGTSPEVIRRIGGTELVVLDYSDPHFRSQVVILEDKYMPGERQEMEGLIISNGSEGFGNHAFYLFSDRAYRYPVLWIHSVVNTNDGFRGYDSDDAPPPYEDLDLPMSPNFSYCCTTSDRMHDYILDLDNDSPVVLQVDTVWNQLKVVYVRNGQWTIESVDDPALFTAVIRNSSGIASLNRNVIERLIALRGQSETRDLDVSAIIDTEARGRYDRSLIYQRLQQEVATRNRTPFTSAIEGNQDNDLWGREMAYRLERSGLDGGKVSWHEIMRSLDQTEGWEVFGGAQVVFGTSFSRLDLKERLQADAILAFFNRNFGRYLAHQCNVSDFHEEWEGNKIVISGRISESGQARLKEKISSSQSIREYTLDLQQNNNVTEFRLTLEVRPPIFGYFVDPNAHTATELFEAMSADLGIAVEALRKLANPTETVQPEFKEMTEHFLLPPSFYTAPTREQLESLSIHDDILKILIQATEDSSVSTLGQWRILVDKLATGTLSQRIGTSQDQLQIFDFKEAIASMPALSIAELANQILEDYMQNRIKICESPQESAIKKISWGDSKIARELKGIWFEASKNTHAPRQSADMFFADWEADVERLLDTYTGDMQLVELRNLHSKMIDENREELALREQLGNISLKSHAQNQIFLRIVAPDGSRLGIDVTFRAFDLENGRTEVSDDDVLRICNDLKTLSIQEAYAQYPLQLSGVGYYAALSHFAQMSNNQQLSTPVAAMLCDDYEQPRGPMLQTMAMSGRGSLAPIIVPKIWVGSTNGHTWDFGTPPDSLTTVLLSSEDLIHLRDLFGVVVSSLESNDMATNAGVLFDTNVRQLEYSIMLPGRRLVMAIENLLASPHSFLPSSINPDEHLNVRPMTIHPRDYQTAVMIPLFLRTMTPKQVERILFSDKGYKEDDVRTSMSTVQLIFDVCALDFSGYTVEEQLDFVRYRDGIYELFSKAVDLLDRIAEANADMSRVFPAEIETIYWKNRFKVAWEIIDEVNLDDRIETSRELVFPDDTPVSQQVEIIKTQIGQLSNEIMDSQAMLYRREQKKQRPDAVQSLVRRISRLDEVSKVIADLEKRGRKVKNLNNNKIPEAAKAQMREALVRENQRIVALFEKEILSLNNYGLDEDAVDSLDFEGLDFEQLKTELEEHAAILVVSIKQSFPAVSHHYDVQMKLITWIKNIQQNLTILARLADLGETDAVTRYLNTLEIDHSVIERLAAEYEVPRDRLSDAEMLNPIYEKMIRARVRAWYDRWIYPEIQEEWKKLNIKTNVSEAVWKKHRYEDMIMGDNGFNNHLNSTLSEIASYSNSFMRFYTNWWYNAAMELIRSGLPLPKFN